ncbi:MAG: 50S ribosomal protein L2 [Parcubacteria group bacterium]|nr:50S ribosomal protein L2 [Parcubacteria group bacterium]
MKKYHPTTPSRRQMSTISYRDVLTASEPYKPLTKGRANRAGRNSAGRITVRHQGGGHKRLHRLIDFRYDKKNIPAKIETVEYDPYRSGFISLVCYADGERRYVLVPKSLKVGDTFLISENAELKAGNRLPLKLIPVGTFIFNIELQPNNGAKLVRGAGNYAELVANDAGYAHIKMPSGEIRKIPDASWASIGEVSNAEHKLVNFGKAGRSRWKGIRPTVRGSAMNPVDHPFGGGEGRQGAGMRRPKNLWGRGIRGVKTRRPKKYSNFLIVSRRTKKKRT